MRHAFVIGGSGMLADTVLWLADMGYSVSVIGRNEAKMERVIRQSPDRLNPVFVDYRDNSRFLQSVRQAIAERGKIDLVVAWIHSDAPDALPIVIAELHDAAVYHVLGSRAKRDDVKADLLIPDTIRYHQVQLGNVVEQGSRRWLTHEEISGGVIEAIQSEKSYHVVGMNGN